MSKEDTSENPIFWVLIIPLSVLLLFSALCVVLFHFFPWPSSAAGFGQAISGVSALFTALAFAGALYAVFLHRKALELQQRPCTFDRMEATDSVLQAVLDGGKKSIEEAIFYLPEGFVKSELQERLKAFLAHRSEGGPCRSKPKAKNPTGSGGQGHQIPSITK